MTELSQVQLSGSGVNPGDLLPNVGELLDSQGNVILTIPNSPNGVLTVLEPGMYQLAASVEGGGFGSLGHPSSTTDFVLSMKGDFKPVPEPRNASLAALLAIALGGLVSRLRCKVIQ